MFRRWAEGTLQSVLASTIIAILPGVVVAHLVRIQSAWSGPVMWGLAASALSIFILLMIDALRRLPPRRVIPNLRNIETCVRDWLNTFQYSVKKSPVETAFFRYLVTVDSGTRMLIGRTKNEYEEYVQIRSDMSPGAEDRKSVEALNDLEKAIVLGEIRLELARRQVGYQNLTLAAETFYIHKRIPIRETLTEHEFIAAIDEVEAAVHAVQLAFALAVAKTGKYQLPETRTIEGV